jgi:hypothetical protein
MAGHARLVVPRISIPEVRGAFWCCLNRNSLSITLIPVKLLQAIPVTITPHYLGTLTIRDKLLRLRLRKT